MGKYKQVILIDDDEITNFINENLIYEAGLTDRVTISVAAEEVLEEIKHSFREDDFPLLVLLDLKMPVFDGFDFLEQFNALKPTLASDVKIVVLTSSENPRDLERLHALGYQEYIIKPLTKEKLQTL